MSVQYPVLVFELTTSSYYALNLVRQDIYKELEFFLTYAMMKFRAFAADFEKSQRGLYNIHLPLSSHPQVIKNSMLKI